MNAEMESRIDANEFRKRVVHAKESRPDIHWYPYNILDNLGWLEKLIPGWGSGGIPAVYAGKRILDIGAADGDLGYFFAANGSNVDFLENEATNFNDCQGIVALGESLGLKHQLLLEDVDRGFKLSGEYELALCLGILYHLRNPMLILIELAHHAKTMILSTRVATHFPDGKRMSGRACAYLLECRESNNDPTNYWILSPEGLRVMLKRSGWKIRESGIYGAKKSDPVSQTSDARMFVYCERVDNWQDLGKHHDF